MPVTVIEIEGVASGASVVQAVLPRAPIGTDPWKPVPPPPPWRVMGIATHQRPLGSATLECHTDGTHRVTEGMLTFRAVEPKAVWFKMSHTALAFYPSFYRNARNHPHEREVAGGVGLVNRHDPGSEHSRCLCSSPPSDRNPTPTRVGGRQDSVHRASRRPSSSEGNTAKASAYSGR
jgi:hypothetical protein